MTNQSTIFRTNSLDRYLNRHDENVVPHFIRPQPWRYVVVLLALFGVVAALLWLTNVPLYETTALGAKVQVGQQRLLFLLWS